MMAILILATFAALAAALLLWAARPVPAPAGPRGDPHASAVAEFRRELHDWDRR